MTLSKLILAVALSWLPLSIAAQAQTPDAETAQDGAETLSPEDMAELTAILERYEALTPRTGAIKLNHSPVTITVPEGYNFYSPADSRVILEEIWNNPPDTTVLGMLTPEDFHPLDAASWAVVYTYDQTGYVTDDDAATTDYNKLLKDMQRETRQANIYRKQNGYPEIELVGWAVEPRYDPQVHGLFWAKDLMFDGNEDAHTLNYDMRLLGRRGVLSMNFVAPLDRLSDIETASPAILTMASFNEGSRYTDYQAGDQKAGYGVAALVAGGAGAVAVAKRTGLLAGLLLFLKKGWFIVVAAFAGLFSLFRRMFGNKEQ